MVSEQAGIGLSTKKQERTILNEKFSRGRPLSTRVILARTLAIVALAFVCAIMAWLVYS